MLRSLTRTLQDACDTFFARLYYPVVCLLLALMTQFTVWFGRKIAADWEQWVIADWLISYAPGFVRRGLTGELLLAASARAGVPANRVTFWLIGVLFGAFAALFAMLLRHKRITFWYFFLCVSPCFVLFTFYNEAAVGRKESLVFVLFVAWALTVAGGRFTTRTALAFAVLCIAVTLVHEMLFFFTPYFVGFAFLASRRRGVDGG